MNDRVCDLFLQRMEPPLNPRDEETLRAFAALMDRHEVWLTGHALLNGVLSVGFADACHRYRVTVREMASVLAQVAHGEHQPWERLALVDAPLHGGARP